MAHPPDLSNLERCVRLFKAVRTVGPSRPHRHRGSPRGPSASAEHTALYGTLYKVVNRATGPERN